MVTGVSVESRTEHLRTTRQALHLEPYRGVGGRHSDSGITEDLRLPGCDAESLGESFMFEVKHTSSD
jgi:hypothetical protein